MEMNKYARTGWHSLALLLATTLLLSGCGVSPLAAADSASNEVITVSGIGYARAEPDKATLSVGVNYADEDIAQAVDQANATIDDITELLLSMGVEAEDIQTTNFSIWGEEQWDQETGQRRPEKLYRVDSNVQITIRQVEDIGKILQEVISAGANNIYGLTFGIADTSALADEARTAALADARRKAEAIANEVDVELGQVISVVDTSGGPVMPSFEGAAMGLGGGGGEPPISEGSMLVTVSVQMAYEIVR
jgi:uncharacterized protein YggE